MKTNEINLKNFFTKKNNVWVFIGPNTFPGFEPATSKLSFLQVPSFDTTYALKPKRKECRLPFKDACHYDFF